MKKPSIFDIIAMVSTTGIMGWVITDFYGGMIIYFFSYGLIIVPVLLMYVISLVETLISIIKNRAKTSKIKVTFHAVTILAMLALNLYHSEIFKSKPVMTATLNDDLFHYTLVLRENGTCETKVSGFLGYTQTFQGSYITRGDTIFFTKKPYNDNFIPDTLLIDTHEGVIFMEKDPNGAFQRTKDWLNYFEIKQ